MEDFKILGLSDEKCLSEEELLDYYLKLRNYLSLLPFDCYSKNQLIIREKLNILIKKILKKIIKYDVVIEGIENIPNTPVIYASSHQDFNDITNSVYSYPEHFLTLNASNISIILKSLLNLNGVFYVDRDSKESRIKAKMDMEIALLKGKSINIYPEATWNCTPSKLHLPFYIGIVDIAKTTGCPIIPVVQEYTYDQSKLDGKSHVTKVNVVFGKPIYVSPLDDRIEKLQEFDEEFSTIRWDLIEKKGIYFHTSIDNSLYSDYIKARIRDWKIPKNDILEERKQVYKSDDDFYLFHYVNDVEFDDNNEFIPTEYVRKLNKIHDKHFNK